MLDIKFIRENSDLVRAVCVTKKDSADIDEILRLDQVIRESLFTVEQLKKERNEATKKIAESKKSGVDAGDLISSMGDLSSKIKDLDRQISDDEKSLHDLLARVPNVPHSSVPHGESEADNVVFSSWGEIREFPYEPLDHMQLSDKLGLFDFKRGAKVAGSGFPLLTGAGAQLNRALINFFLDEHRSNGYSEVQPPYFVNSESAFGTGQLPKSQEQMYYAERDELYAIPTAEVPVTNIYRDEMLTENDLTIKMCAYSACFRREAGSYGKDTKGFLRVHQFDKVEMVKLCREEDSYEELELLRQDAESLLQKLELPYRVLSLCDADISFAAAKCYDLEVWSPAEKTWLEVSSVSNFESFQSRRMNIRYRPNGGGKPRFVHTLNGSGLATARILVAILENYQTERATVMVPKVLQPYMNGLTEITL